MLGKGTNALWSEGTLIGALLGEKGLYLLQALLVGIVSSINLSC